MDKLLLDLYCGAGGAAEGYHRVGFKIVGIDIVPQPHYPFDFIQTDALVYLASHWRGFDVIHASPPCQAFTRANTLKHAQGRHNEPVDLLTPTLDYLRAHVVMPWVVENVPNAPLHKDLILCGSMFGLKVRRHRVFESNVFLPEAPICRHHEQGRPVGVYHSMNDDIPQGGRTARTLEEGQEAMGIDWMVWKELTQAVPPAYTQFIGEHLG